LICELRENEVPRGVLHPEVFRVRESAVAATAPGQLRVLAVGGHTVFHSKPVLLLWVVGIAAAGIMLAKNSSPAQRGEHPPETAASSAPERLTPARLWRAPKIAYPDGTSTPLPEGTVTVRVKVSEHGTVNSAVVAHPLNPALDATAEASALQCTFIPATKNGTPAPAEVSVDVIFVSPHPYVIAANAIYGISKGVTPPHAILAPDPEYTDAAREAKLSGTVVLWVLVNEEGVPERVKVQRSFDAGLDQKAVDAVRKWKFEPARKNGQPVAMMINTEVNFRPN